MRSLLLVALFLAFAVPSRAASTVTVEANDSSGFSDAQGVDLQSGSVLLGTFQLANGSAMSDSAIQAFGSDSVG